MNRPAEAPEAVMSSRGQRLLFLALAIATLAVYGQVLGFDFVNYDDPSYLLENPVVRGGWSWDGLEWALTTHYHHHWHPLTWLSHMTDVEFFGLEPGGHHATNLLLHLATVLLLFHFLVRTTGAAWRSAVVAGLFALHPLHVETVAWVADRKDVLAGFFWMVVLVSYARYCASPGWLRYGVVVFSLVAGLMAKSMVGTLPIVLLLLDFWPLRRWPLTPAADDDPAAVRARRIAVARLVGEKAVLLAIAATVILSAAETMNWEGGGGLQGLAPRTKSIETAVVSYATYLVKAVAPVGLSAIYPRVETGFGQALAAELLLLAITMPIIVYWRRRPALLTGWLWFLITLGPVVGLIRSGPVTMADRYTYIPLTGFFIMLVWGIADLLPAVRWRKPLLAGLGATALVACGSLATLQTRHWRDSEALNRHMIRVDPENGAARAGLAGALLDQGYTEEAVVELEQAARFEPNNEMVHMSLGRIREAQGQLDEAAIHFERAFEIDAEIPDLAPTLARIHERQGRLGEALRYYKVVLWFENSAANHFNVGRLFGLRGETDQEIFHYRQALSLDPAHRPSLGAMAKWIRSEQSGEADAVPAP